MSEGNVHRRWLLAAGAAGCFAGLTPNALAQELRRARAAGRPLFTAAALNDMIPPPGDPRHGPFLLEAAQDIPGFIRGRFTLTAQQEAELASIRPADLAALQNRLRRAAATGAPVRLEIETRQTTLAASPRNPAAGIEVRSSSREQAEQERRAREQQERSRELQEELEQIQEEVDDAWGKIGKLFGGDGGLADTQEFRIGGNVRQLMPARNLSTLPR
jgi:hypothetical protein